MQVTLLDFKNNELTALPASIFEMPALKDLYLQNNRLTELPQVRAWPRPLMTLDLSYNKLNSLPENVQAKRLYSLNLSHNKFRFVPSCIFTFCNLRSLYLDNNPDIVSLPKELGELKELSRISLYNLKCLVSPPKALHLDTKSCLAYLRNMSSKSKPLCSTNMMVVGPHSKGKTSFVNYLINKKCGEEKPTSEVEVHSWTCSSSSLKITFQFRIWDFSGNETYFVTQQIFLFPNSLYLVVFNLNDGDVGIQELKPWLNYISLAAPHSNIVIIGTHLDQIPKEKRNNTDVMFKHILNLAEFYDKIHIIDMIAVGLENDMEFGEWLRNTICKCAKFQSNLNCKDVPAVYNKLNVEFKLLEQQSAKGIRSPFMHMEEFKTMVLATYTREIHDEQALKKVMEYLSSAGAFVHCADHYHFMNDLFFIDFQWLCILLTNTINYCKQNEMPKNGILDFRSILSLFKNTNSLWWDNSGQCVTFLENFEIGLQLDAKHVMIPSLLPSEPPQILREMPQPDISIHTRSMVFKTAIPSGFWNFLLFRIFQSISLVRQAVVNSLESDHQTLEDVIGNNQSTLDRFYGVPTTEDSFTASNTTPSAISQNDQYNTCEQSTIPEHVSYGPKASRFRLEYWKTGLYYRSTSVMFHVEAMADFGDNGGRGIQILSSFNNQGREITTQIVDLVYSVIKKWYPGLTEDPEELEQNIVCPECTKAKTSNPYEYSFHQCLLSRAENVTVIKCHSNDPAEKHTVCLHDIVPDVFLHDIDHSVLEYSDIYCHETSVISQGKYGTVYKGIFQNKPVAVEKYSIHNALTFHDMREKVKQLSRFRHPFLVSLVGICINPMAIIVERSPLGLLSFFLAEQTCILRLTFFKIAAEVAAALRFLHSNGIVLGNFNVMMWTFDPTCLCHCKVVNHTTKAYNQDIEEELIYYKKGFVAPEILEIGKEKHTLSCNHAADSYSYGMFLYQMLTRCHPYHLTHPHRIDEVVMNGSRPRLEGIVSFKGGYNYLSMLLKQCREYQPKDRPNMDVIINLMTSVEVQSLVGVHPVNDKSLPYCAAGFSLSDPEEATSITLQDDLWLFYNSEEGSHIRIFNSHTMTKVVSKNLPQTKQIKCVTLRQNQIWISSNQGTDKSRIDVYSAVYRACLYNLTLDQSHVTCMAAIKENVLIGTHEGMVYMFTDNVDDLKASSVPRVIHTFEHPITGIICSTSSIWISHANFIEFFDSQSFCLKGFVSLELKGETSISQLSHTFRDELVWSVCFGESVLTAWNATSHNHAFDIDTSEILHRVSDDVDPQSFVITAMTTALNTTWVGMKTGHILVFSHRKLITWHRPFTESVHLLSSFPVSGADTMEKFKVMSYGCTISQHVEQADFDGIGKSIRKNFLVIWDVYDAITLWQMKLIEENAPDLFDNYQSIQQVTHSGKFKDISSIEKEYQVLGNISGDAVEEVKNSSSLHENLDHDKAVCDVPLCDKQDIEQSKQYPEQPNSTTIERKTDELCVVFEMDLPSSNTIKVTLTKPPMLKKLLLEIETTVLLESSKWNIYYRYLEDNIIIDSQEEMDDYMSLQNKPNLLFQLKPN